MTMIRYTITYYYGSYSGTETVVMSDDEDESPIDKMWRQLRPHMSLGMASRSAKIIKEEVIDDDDEPNGVDELQHGYRRHIAPRKDVDGAY